MYFRNNTASRGFVLVKLSMFLSSICSKKLKLSCLPIKDKQLSLVSGVLFKAAAV